VSVKHIFPRHTLVSEPLVLLAQLHDLDKLKLLRPAKTPICCRSLRNRSSHCNYLFVAAGKLESEQVVGCWSVHNDVSIYTLYGCICKYLYIYIYTYAHHVTYIAYTCLHVFSISFVKHVIRNHRTRSCGVLGTRRHRCDNSLGQGKYDCWINVIWNKKGP